MLGTLLKAATCLVVIVIGGVAGANAVSTVQTRENPQAATGLSVYNAAAYERLAIASTVVADDAVSLDLSAATAPARKAFELGPLSTEAAAILVLADADVDAATRARNMETVADLSLRGRLLNFGVLQSATQAEDPVMALAAIDRILVLYSDLRRQLLTQLVTSVTDDAMLGSFEQILATDPDWTDELFSFGAREPQALPNLVRLRLSMADTISLDPRTDRNLLAALVRRELWPEAFALHDLVENDAAATQGPILAWGSTYPPFDWTLADDRDFHARPSPDRSTVDLRIDSGSGGLLAQRIIVRPEAANGLLVSHAISPAESGGAISMTVNCVETGAQLGEAEFFTSPTLVAFEQSPCEWLELSLNGRVMSGELGIRGEITELRFVD